MVARFIRMVKWYVPFLNLTNNFSSYVDGTGQIFSIKTMPSDGTLSFTFIASGTDGLFWYFRLAPVKWAWCDIGRYYHQENTSNLLLILMAWQYAYVCMYSWKGRRLHETIVTWRADGMYLGTWVLYSILRAYYKQNRIWYKYFRAMTQCMIRGITSKYTIRKWKLRCNCPNCPRQIHSISKPLRVEKCCNNWYKIWRDIFLRVNKWRTTICMHML